MMPSFEELDRRGLAGEPLRIVFFGGSLTWGANASDPQKTSYRARMADFLRNRYPRSPLVFHDASIGGTGSKLGLFRLERDVLSHRPDLVFLDFAVNDGLTGKDRRALFAYETLLRTLIQHDIPVVQAFFCFQTNFQPYNPDSLCGYRDRLALADAYQTACGDALACIAGRTASGTADLSVLWGIDGGHPDDPGYALFFEAVRDGFLQAVGEARRCRLPAAPVFRGSYRNRVRRHLPIDPPREGWRRAKTYRTSLWFDGLSSRWMDDVIACSARGETAIAPLRIEFHGQLIGILGEADQHGLGFKALIDGKTLPPPRSPGSGGEGWTFRPPDELPGRLLIWRVLADDLPPGRHLLEIVPILPAFAKEGELRLESICSAEEETF